MLKPVVKEVTPKNAEKKTDLHSGFVAIVGRPNVGKSTILNRILNTDLSITSPKAQTTRESILGIMTEAELGQMVFTDTPGIHRARKGGINEAMMLEVQTALESPDLVWYLVDFRSEIHHEEAVFEQLQRVALSVPIFVVFNKADEVEKPRFASDKDLFLEKRARLQRELLVELEKQGRKVAGVFFTSAVKGSGLEELKAATWQTLPRGPFFYPDAEALSDRPVRFFVSEKIRQQLFRNLGDEIPYSCAVNLLNFDENAKPLRIEAEIWVERSSQKGMVVGQGGKKIKEIGIAAREQIESFLGEKIFLGLQVKHVPDWTHDPALLKLLGLRLPKESKDKARAKEKRGES